MILDDRSRLITGGRFFYQDNSFNFQKVLKDAVATYGIPQKLYVDNCSPYKNSGRTATYAAATRSAPVTVRRTLSAPTC